MDPVNQSIHGDDWCSGLERLCPRQLGSGALGSTPSSELVKNQWSARSGCIQYWDPRLLSGIMTLNGTMDDLCRPTGLLLSALVICLEKRVINTINKNNNNPYSRSLAY
jgi:hypothetical protein